MSISFNFTYKNIQHNATLALTDSPSEKTVSIAGRNYKILGSEEDVSLLRSHIANLDRNDFENIDSFKASLSNIGPHEKTNGIFQKALDSSPLEKITNIEVTEISRVLEEQEVFDVHDCVRKACDLIETHYIFPGEAKKGIEIIKARLSEGHYDNIKDANAFADVFAQDLRSILHDKHFDIVILPFQEKQTAPNEEVWIANLQDINFGFDVEKNSANIGILKLYQFHGVDFSNRDYVPPKIAQKTREAFDNAIEMMRGANAIIVDMTENGGGSPYAVQYLSSYFLPEQTQLNTIRSRENEKENIQKFDTLSYEELPVEKRLLEVPLYILTSKNTFSAAEEFTYDMQVLGRGEVIGEVSGGGANPCHLKPLNDKGLHIAIPDEEAINPHTKTNWEGQGVSPNHMVAADKALEKANELIKARR